MRSILGTFIEQYADKGLEKLKQELEGLRSDLEIYRNKQSLNTVDLVLLDAVRGLLWNLKDGLEYYENQTGKDVSEIYKIVEELTDFVSRNFGKYLSKIAEVGLFDVLIVE